MRDTTKELPQDAIRTVALTRYIITSTTPEEAALFDELARSYYVNGAAESNRATDRQGGVGALGGDVVLSFLLFSVLQPLISAIFSGVQDGIKDLSSDATKALIKPHVDQLVSELHSRNGSSKKVGNLISWLLRLKAE